MLVIVEKVNWKVGRSLGKVEVEGGIVGEIMSEWWVVYYFV